MRDYYQLTKPGIVYGNALTALAAFLFASRQVGAFALPLLVATLLGLSLSIAAACVINNIYDRDIDRHMERTGERALPAGRITPSSAGIFAAALAVLGGAILFFSTNLYAFFVTLFGVFVYTRLYTPAKRLTVHSTLIGAVAGAVPPVVGYAAVANALDIRALLLFLILVCWQMAHFFAIALFRKEDYAAAGLPVMPVALGVARTEALMGIYTVLFAGAIFAFAIVTQASFLFTIPMGITCAGWIALACSGLRTKKDARRTFARTMFFYSLATLLVFSAALVAA